MKQLLLFFFLSIFLFACNNESDLPTKNPITKSELLEFEYQDIKYSTLIEFDSEENIIIHNSSVRELINKLKQIPTLSVIYRENDIILIEDSDVNYVTTKKLSEDIITGSTRTSYAVGYLYEQKNYKGRSYGILVGDQYNDLSIFGVINNFFSMKLINQSDKTVRLVAYDNINCTGKSLILSANPNSTNGIIDVDNLYTTWRIIGYEPAFKWSEIISSVKCFYVE